MMWTEAGYVSELEKLHFHDMVLKRKVAVIYQNRSGGVPWRIMLTHPFQSISQKIQTPPAQFLFWSL